MAHGDVEHFRPKKIYWWLAYCYDNMLYACQLCNQSFKSDHFPVGAPRMKGPNVKPSATDAQLKAIAGKLAPDPLDGAAGLPLQSFIASASQEAPGLVDPYQRAPEPLFAWEADDVLKEVKVAPRDSSTAAKGAFAAVVKFCGLNREDLRRERHRSLSELELCRRVFEDPAVPASLRQQAAAMLRAKMASDAPYAGMCRYFVKAVWKLSLP
ncbi:MAG: hypothetical protein HY721_22815 [Planctomycetes bacterium]|nr:hypothetical protein [Planctomycetota bacterium]